MRIKQVTRKPSCRPSPFRSAALACALAVLALTSSSCGRDEKPATAPDGARAAGGYRQKGLASWYGPKFHGRTTASGERYNMFDMTAAHKTLPFGTKVKITNLENGRKVHVRIKIIDLSYAAAKELDITRSGVVKVKLEVVPP
jgi:rare lipoprotein A (peptidoglycan hydrolase)